MCFVLGKWKKKWNSKAISNNSARLEREQRNRKMNSKSTGEDFSATRIESTTRLCIHTRPSNAKPKYFQDENVTKIGWVVSAVVTQLRCKTKHKRISRKFSDDFLSFYFQFFWWIFILWGFVFLCLCLWMLNVCSSNVRIVFKLHWIHEIIVWCFFFLVYFLVLDKFFNFFHLPAESKCCSLFHYFIFIFVVIFSSLFSVVGFIHHPIFRTHAQNSYSTMTTKTCFSLSSRSHSLCVYFIR